MENTDRAERVRRWPRRLAMALALLGVLLGGSALVLPRLAGDGADWSQVASIERDSTWQDPALLDRAFHLPVAARYAPEGAASIDYQRNPTFCGLTSVVNVMHSLGEPTNQAHVLDGTGVDSYLGFVPSGLTLEELAGVARVRTGRPVTVLRDLDLAAFRAEVARSNDPSLRYIVNFTRGPLFGRGGGHHSPLGGYLADRDLVLVLDVNRKFRPWLVPTARLWEATRQVDRQSGKPRGLLRIERR